MLQNNFHNVTRCVDTKSITRVMFKQAEVNDEAKNFSSKSNENNSKLTSSIKESIFKTKINSCGASSPSFFQRAEIPA